MNAIEACLEAVALNHGLVVDEIINPPTRQMHGYPRRLAAYVAMAAFEVDGDDVARHFKRAPDWPQDAFERVYRERQQSQITARDVEDAKRRARAILDRHPGATTPPPRGPLSPLDEVKTAEARRLRAKGWAIPGLAKRYGITPEQMAPIIGETWGRVL